MQISKSVAKTCCFIGHREILNADKLSKELRKTVESLIVTDGVECFLFGAKGEFDALCYDVVSGLREKYPHIRRTYVRAEYPTIGGAYERHLLACYEDTFFPESVRGAGRASYVKRNLELVDLSLYCVFYVLRDYVPKQGKSGARLALDHAKKKMRRIICFP